MSYEIARLNNLWDPWYPWRWLFPPKKSSPSNRAGNLSLENTENTCKRIVSAKRDLAYRDQVELVIQPRMDKLQQVYKIYQAQKRFEIAANLSSLDNSAFRQNEKQLDSKWKSNECQTTQVYLMYQSMHHKRS